MEPRHDETTADHVEQRAYSRAQVARMTTQSKGKVDLDIRRGLLRARKLGRRVVILREDLDTYLRGDAV